MTKSPDSTLLPEDTVGAATLERMATAPAYNHWMYERLEPWIGSRVLELGSGIGNMSQFFIDRDRVVLTDTEVFYRQELERRFGDRPHVAVTEVSLPHASEELREERFDTVVCLNVLEHIEDDEASLRAMHDLLQVGGHLALLVPALPAIYGSLDRALGHHRRYTPGTLRTLYEKVRFRLARMEYFNLAGILGWWWTGRVLKKEMIPMGSLALYDKLVPLFRLERLLPARIGQSLIAIGERTR